MLRVAAAPLGAAAALLALVAGCATPPPPEPPTDDELRSQIENDSFDPNPPFELAHRYEARGWYEKAIALYGMAVNRLPPRSGTRPVLDLGILHHRLGNTAAAARCYDEVLATHPALTTRYRENPDYRRAALGRKLLLTDDPLALASLEARFLDELGGTPEQWAAGAPWITPLDPEVTVPDTPPFPPVPSSSAGS